MLAYSELYEQYIDDAAFLWVLRCIALEQPHYTVDDLRELEQRIDNQLDALMVAGVAAWQLCLSALAHEEPGEVFTAAILAFKSHDSEKIQTVIKVGLKTSASFNALVSALDWLPDTLCHRWLNKFLVSKDLNHKHLALAVCSLRQQNPGDTLHKILSREDCKQHKALYVQALRLVGELRRQDLMPQLKQAASAEDSDIKFWANYSAIVLGDHAAVIHLAPYVFGQGQHQAAAINLVFSVLPVTQAREWLSRLVNDPAHSRAVIKASGVLGDPHAVNWLITKMHDPLLAKIAAEAFTLITGLDLLQHKLGLDPAAKAVQQANDTKHADLIGEDPSDNNTALDEDEHLPYPAAEAIASIWMHFGQHFITGQRYFLGESISIAWLQEKRDTAPQRHRHLANLQLMLMGDTLLMNTRSKIT